jgi:hypothetical protein
MDPATERSWSARALRCFACDARSAKAQEMAEGKARTTGLYFLAEMNDQQ